MPIRSALLHIGLFLATCATTFWAGATFQGAFNPADGIAFSATLMSILVCHEFGHYIVARRHGIPASLPYFIPLPPMISLGTMGAVIQMKQPITNRNQLIDVGAAGPLAGLVIAIPCLLYGLSISHLSPPPADPAAAGLIEGNSLLYLALKYIVYGRYLPAADGTDVMLHPMAWAAWVGLLLTMVNLIPVGQLDGGHIAAAFLGNRHETFSKYLHRSLLGVFAVTATLLAVDSHGSGRSWGAAIASAVSAAMPWLVWSVLLLVLYRLSGRVYHPKVSEEPLSRSRRWLVALMLLVFLLIFTPVPLRELQLPQ